MNTKKNTPKNTGFNNVCSICDFECSKQSDYARHITTAKHIRRTNTNYFTQENAIINLFTCHCGKEYKHQSSLWNHKKKCSQITIDNSVLENTFTPTIEPSGNTMQLLDVNIVLELLKQNQEFKELLIEQNKQMMELSKENNSNMMEIAGKIGNTTNNTNSHCNNNNNTQFNLQVFLNEKCKDAVCISDFIKDISVSFQQLENIGKNGYVDGLVDVILSNLNKLDITKRPLHCSDIKRDTMHIKQPTEWTKDDNDNTMMTNIFRRIANKNLRTIKAWSDENPISQESGTPENEFITGVMLHSLGAVGSTQTKMDNTVLKRIAKSVLIDKTM